MKSSKQRTTAAGHLMWDVMVPVERDDGETVWIKVGHVFQDDEKIAVKVQALPLPPWNGTVYLYPSRK